MTDTASQAIPRPMPPPRPGVRHVRVPVVGLIVADDDLRRRVHRFFFWPMIILALAVLPLLLVEHLYLTERDSGSGLWWACWAAFLVIWLAFVIEFAIKITIAECRLEYLRRNWLDVVIILVPVLRPVRAATLARTSRVFTLRGVGTKFARYVITLIIGLDATEKLLHKMGVKAVTGRRDPATMTRHQLVAELRKLRGLADAWEAWYAAHQAHLEEHGEARDGFRTPPPADDE